MLIVRLLFTLVMLSGSCLWADPAPEASIPLTLGQLRLDPETHSVVATGRINQVEGLVELLACGYQGKIHESLLVLDLNPVDLHAALLLMGCQPGHPPSAAGQGQPKGAPLDLWVVWTEDGQTNRVRAEQLLLHKETGEPLPDTAWIFSGARDENGEYGALLDYSFVATYWDPWSVVNIGLAVGTNDDVVAVNPKKTPPLNTPIELYFQARP